MPDMTLFATALLTASLTFGAGSDATAGLRCARTGGGRRTSDRTRRSCAVPGRVDAGAQRTERSRDHGLSVRTEKDKPAADLTSEAMPKQSISDFSMSDKSLVMGYSFTYEGNPVSAVIYLTPAPDAAMKAQIDFAGGAYVMNGTATKKEKDKR